MNFLFESKYLREGKELQKANFINRLLGRHTLIPWKANYKKSSCCDNFLRGIKFVYAMKILKIRYSE